MSQGRWIYPNGTYYEGAFTANKPNGDGCWFFKNGNEMAGAYEQRQKGEEEDEQASQGEGEEGAAKTKTELVWHAKTNIVGSANHVNSVQQ